MRKERDLFAALPTIDEAVSRRLHQRLVDAASAAGLLDVAYRTIETPVGTLLLAATPKGLVRVAYASEDHGLVLERLARDVSLRNQPAARRGALSPRRAERRHHRTVRRWRRSQAHAARAGVGRLSPRAK